MKNEAKTTNVPAQTTELKRVRFKEVNEIRVFEIDEQDRNERREHYRGIMKEVKLRRLGRKKSGKSSSPLSEKVMLRNIRIEVANSSSNPFVCPGDVCTPSYLENPSEITFEADEFCATLDEEEDQEDEYEEEEEEATLDEDIDK